MICTFTVSLQNYGIQVMGAKFSISVRQTKKTKRLNMQIKVIIINIILFLTCQSGSLSEGNRLKYFWASCTGGRVCIFRLVHVWTNITRLLKVYRPRRSFPQLDKWVMKILICEQKEGERKSAKLLFNMVEMSWGLAAIYIF